VLEACRKGGIPKLIFASSDKAYGASDALPYREDTPLRAIHTYDASKAAADMLARSYWHSYELPVAVTRFANLYGGGDLNFSRLIPEAVSALLDGRRPVIRSDGTPERDFLYVEDATRAYLAIDDALGDGVAGEAFNAGGERPHSVAEVLQLLSEVSGTELQPDIRGSGNPEGENDRQYVDSAKLREATGWRPQVELRDGLARTIDWYREHPEARAPAP
jgi:CDP-glucose 4,6-dehydratase